MTAVGGETTIVAVGIEEVEKRTRGYGRGGRCGEEDGGGKESGVWRGDIYER